MIITIAAIIDERNLAISELPKQITVIRDAGIGNKPTRRGRRSLQTNGDSK